MFATSFPDLRWLKDQAENRFYRPLPATGAEPGKGWPTVVLNVQASEIWRDNILGPLSLFSNWSGRSRVSVDGRTFDIPEECFLLTNEKQRYTLEIDKRRAETFNIHFGEEWIREATTSLTRGHESLTDGSPAEPFAFYNKLFRKTPEIQSILRQLHQHANGDAMRREEILLTLLKKLLEEQLEERLLLERVDAAKPSTRNEILRRLHIATDLMHTSLGNNISLDEVAKASMLSKFHLLRAFRDVFNQTPYQYLTKLRIEKARLLLRDTELEVNEIGAMLGFDTSSTFSRRFRKVTGVYPSQYRLQN